MLQGAGNTTERVKKSEIESILNLLDAEADRILQGYSGSGVLYGGMQEDVIIPVEQTTEKVIPLQFLFFSTFLHNNLLKL